MFKLKFDEILKNNHILNDLKNQSISLRTNSTISMPAGRTPETKISNIIEKTNETNLNNTNSTNLTKSTTNIGLYDESASTIYDPRKSMISDLNDEEHARKGKNVVDKFKHSLPSSVFKKREFVIDKSITLSAEKGKIFNFLYYIFNYKKNKLNSIFLFVLFNKI